jgi:hypothetical protein
MYLPAQETYLRELDTYLPALDAYMHVLEENPEGATRYARFRKQYAPSGGLYRPRHGHATHASAENDRTDARIASTPDEMMRPVSDRKATRTHRSPARSVLGVGVGPNPGACNAPLFAVALALLGWRGLPTHGGRYEAGSRRVIHKDHEKDEGA